MKYSIKNFFSRSLKWFSLAELLIVMFILVILSVMSFLLLDKWLVKSRDSRRLSDIRNIEKAMEITMVEKWDYPIPTDYWEVTYGWENLRYQWSLGKNTIWKVDSLSKIPTDPMWNKYTYSITLDHKQYEVGALIEEKSSYEQFSNKFVDKVYANNFSSFIKWTYNWVALKGEYWNIYAVPTIISWDPSINLKGQQDILAFNGKGNLPATYKRLWDERIWYYTTWEFTYEVKKIWTEKDSPETDEELIDFWKRLQNVYSGTDLSEELYYDKMIKREDKKKLAEEVIKNMWWNKNIWWWLTKTYWIWENGNLKIKEENTLINLYWYITDSEVETWSNKIKVDSTDWFSESDEILIIQSQNIEKAGNYEYNKIIDINNNTLTLLDPLKNWYVSWNPDNTNSSVAQIVNVPNYNNLTIATWAKIVSSKWNWKKWGIIAFKVSWNLNVYGDISVSWQWYRWGNRGWSSAVRWESYVWYNSKSRSDRYWAWGGWKYISCRGDVWNWGGWWAYWSNWSKWARWCKDRAWRWWHSYWIENLSKLYFWWGGWWGAWDYRWWDWDSRHWWYWWRSWGIAIIKAQKINLNGTINSNWWNWTNCSPTGDAEPWSGWGWAWWSIYIESDNIFNNWQIKAYWWNGAHRGLNWWNGWIWRIAIYSNDNFSTGWIAPSPYLSN